MIGKTNALAGGGGALKFAEQYHNETSTDGYAVTMTMETDFTPMVIIFNFPSGNQRYTKQCYRLSGNDEFTEFKLPGSASTGDNATITVTGNTIKAKTFTATSNRGNHCLWVFGM